MIFAILFFTYLYYRFKKRESSDSILLKSQVLSTFISLLIGFSSLVLPLYLFQIQTITNDIDISLKINGAPAEFLGHEPSSKIQRTLHRLQTSFHISKNQGSGNVKNIYAVHFINNDNKKPLIDNIIKSPFSSEKIEKSNIVPMFFDYNTLSCLNNANFFCEFGITFHDLNFLSYYTFFIIIEGVNGSKQFFPLILYFAGYSQVGSPYNAYSKSLLYSESNFITAMSLDEPLGDFFQDTSINNNIQTVCTNSDITDVDRERLKKRCEEINNTIQEERYVKFKTFTQEQLTEVKKIFSFK